MPSLRLAPHMNKVDFISILRDHRVDFIVVEGVGAVLQGAPLATFDLDVVHARAGQNIARLLGALEALDACYRMQPEKRLRPGASQLASAGHQLLITRFGPLDLLGIGQSRTYEDLLGHTAELTVAEGLAVRVLDLETLIAVKEEVEAEKDRAVLPLLRRTLDERRRQAL